MSEQTATEINIIENRRLIAYARLQAYPEAQAIIIAKHYIAHAILAKEIVEVIERYDYHPVVNELVSKLVGTIKENHLIDLGIALDWSRPL